MCMCVCVHVCGEQAPSTITIDGDKPLSRACKPVFAGGVRLLFGMLEVAGERDAEMCERLLAQVALQCRLLHRAHKLCPLLLTPSPSCRVFRSAMC